MKHLESGKTFSPSMEDTQVGNRVKRRRISNPNLFKTPQNPSTQSPNPTNPIPEKPSIKYPSKFKYRRFNTPEGERRYSSLKGSLLTGKTVNFEKFSDFALCFKENNLEAMYLFERPDFYYGLIGELFCNLESKVDSGNNLELVSTVAGQSVILNELQICRALNLSTRMLDFPKLNSPAFAFNKPEFHKILEHLSGSPVPPGQFEKEMLVSAEFLFPPAQFTAIILRTNFLPRFGTEKLFSFCELKVIHHLLKHDLKLNVPHPILSHIVSSNQSNTMVFGILLTAIFKYLNLPLFEHSYTTVNSVIHSRNIKQSVPLGDSMVIDGNTVEHAVNKIVVDESLKKLLGQLEGSFEKKIQELRGLVENMERKFETFKTEKQKTSDQYAEDNSLLISTTGELQNKIYILEEFYMSLSTQNSRVYGNPNSGLEKLQNLAAECELFESDDKRALNSNGETGQTSQLIGTSSSQPSNTTSFAPLGF